MGIVNYRRAFFGLLLEDLEAADDRLHLRCELDTGRHVIALAALSPRAGQGRPEQTRRTLRPRTTRRARSDRIRRFGRRISLPTLAGPRCSRHSIRLNVLARHHPGVRGRPCRTLWRSQGPAEGTYGEGPPAPENPSLLVMSLQGGGRSSGGPVDQYVGGRAFGWSAQVDASHILDLAKEPDAELVAGSGHIRERFLDVRSLEPHQHEAPHRSLLQGPSLPSNSRCGLQSLEPLPALPNACGREVPALLFFAGKDRERAIEHCHWALLLVRPPLH